jgi:hypothetical protein
MSITLTNSPTASVTAHISPTDTMGRPMVAANIRWVTSNPAELTLTPFTDGLSCEIKATGPVSNPARPPSIAVTADGFQSENSVIIVVEPAPIPGALNLTFDAPLP